MRFRTNGLTGTITGSGQVNLLSGRIWLNGLGFGYAMRCVIASPLGHGAGPLGRTGRARGEAGWAAP
jgi:hypothetical protein